MKQIEAVQQALEAKGFKARIWKDRIYLNGYGRDIKAFFTFDDPESEVEEDLFAGSALKVFSDCEQGRQWLVNRAKQVKHDIMGSLHSAGLSDIEPCSSWREVIL